MHSNMNIFQMEFISRKKVSMAQLDARPIGDQEIAGSTPRRVRQHSFVEIDSEIFSTVILSLPLI